MKRKSPGFSSLEIHKNRTTNARDMILGSTYRRKFEPLVKKLEKFQRNRDKSYDKAKKTAEKCTENSPSCFFKSRLIAWYTIETIV